jgi:hypothetical protein
MLKPDERVHLTPEATDLASVDDDVFRRSYGLDGDELGTKKPMAAARRSL